MKTKPFIVALFVCVVCMSCKNLEVLSEDLPNTDTIPAVDTTLLYKPYIPMIVPGNQWNELFENISLRPDQQYWRTYLTKIGNDTVINGVTYYKLLTAEDSLSVEWTTKGLVREDTIKQQVYFKPTDSSEVLWYDFQVQTGEELRLYDISLGKEVSITVYRIDSILIGTVWHKRITIHVGHDYHKWIEGIGGTNSLLHNVLDNFPGKTSYALLCFFQHGQLIYKADNGIDECFVWKYIMKSMECAQTEKVGELNIQNVKLLKARPENPNGTVEPFIYESDGIVILHRINGIIIIYEICNFPQELLQSNENLTVNIRGNIFEPSRYWGGHPMDRTFYDLEITNLEIQ